MSRIISTFARAVVRFAAGVLLLFLGLFGPGVGHSSVAVSVNANPTERAGSYWRYETAVNNSTGAVRQAFAVVGVLPGAGTDG